MREVVITRLNIADRPLGLLLLFSDRKGQTDPAYLQRQSGGCRWRGRKAAYTPDDISLEDPAPEDPERIFG